MAAGKEARKDRLMDLIRAEKETPAYDQRVSARLTDEQMEGLQKAATKVGVPYTRLAALLIVEGVEILNS